MQPPIWFARRRAMAYLAILALGCLTACGQTDDEPTAPHAAAREPVVAIDVGERVTVSGVSSGAYMAVQVHVALAGQIAGVAALAGGPWHCAEGLAANAIGRCLTGEGLDVSSLIAYAYELAASEQIASVDKIARSRVFILHSPDDKLVSPALSKRLRDFYAAFVPASEIVLVEDVRSAHGWPTIDSGNACDQGGTPFLTACGYDAAGALLAHLYGRLEPRRPMAGGGELSTVSLAEYFDAGSGVAEHGFIYVPDPCTAIDSTCRLHIAFHGCRMGAGFIDDRFAAGAGLNEWAATNGIVVLYPQVEKSAANPQGCWDWWGYLGRNYDRKSGRQIAGIGRIVSAFAAGSLSGH